MTLCARNSPPGVHARKHHVEELLVVGLPGVEEHEVERARQLRDLLERIARNHRDDVREPGGRMFSAASFARTGSYSMVIRRPPVSREPRPIQMAL